MVSVCSFQGTSCSLKFRNCSDAGNGAKKPLGVSEPLQTVFGGHKAVARPDPIPNSAVKHSLADGSACIACARVGCRQIFLKSRNGQTRSGFFILISSTAAALMARFHQPYRQVQTG